MILNDVVSLQENRRILHVCGDDPGTVFQVNLILMCILHVCGDDPAFDAKLIDGFQYSPRMWR